MLKKCNLIYRIFKDDVKKIPNTERFPGYFFYMAFEIMANKIIVKTSLAA